MKKYYVSIPLYATAIYVVEAENDEEALDKAFDVGLPHLCHQCGNDMEINDWALDTDPIVEEA